MAHLVVWPARSLSLHMTSTSVPDQVSARAANVNRAATAASLPNRLIRTPPLFVLSIDYKLKGVEEEVLGKAYDSRLMRRLLSYMRPYRWLVLASLAFLLVQSVLQVVGPLLTKVA